MYNPPKSANYEKFDISNKHLIITNGKIWQYFYKVLIVSSQSSPFVQFISLHVYTQLSNGKLNLLTPF